MGGENAALFWRSRVKAQVLRSLSDVCNFSENVGESAKFPILDAVRSGHLTPRSNTDNDFSPNLMCQIRVNAEVLRDLS